MIAGSKTAQSKLIDLEDIKPLETVAADEQKAIAERMQVENTLNRLKPEHKASGSENHERLQRGGTAQMLGKAKQCASCSTRHCRYCSANADEERLNREDERWMTKRIFFRI